MIVSYIIHMVAADMWMSSQKSMTEADLEEEECIILGEFMELEMREGGYYGWLMPTA